jgi:hypothetical protein
MTVSIKALCCGGSTRPVTTPQHVKVSGMSNRDRSDVLLGVAIIVVSTAVLAGVLVFPILLGWPVGFGLYRYRAEV